MNISTEIKDLAAALAKAQSEMSTASLSSTNPFFKSKYADFGEIVKASRPALTANGLSVSQPIIIENDSHVLVTILLHSSGQYIQSKMKLAPAKQDIQSLGSHITYLKRYCYAALICVVVGEDDDGESDMQRDNYKSEPNNIVYVTTEQLDYLEEELQDHIDIAQQVLKGLNITTLSKMPRHVFNASMRRIKELKDMKVK